MRNPALIQHFRNKMPLSVKRAVASLNANLYGGGGEWNDTLLDRVKNWLQSTSCYIYEDFEETEDIYTRYAKNRTRIDASDMKIAILGRLGEYV